MNYKKMGASYCVTMNNFELELQRTKKLVEQRLKRFFNSEKSKTKKIAPFLSELLGRVEEFTLRGSSKRLRACLVYIGYQAVRSQPPRAIDDVAAAIELIHSHLLIHDDIIDDDEWRRGGMTVHAYFEKYRRQKFAREETKRFGIAQAILAGDISCSLAGLIIAGSQLLPSQKVMALERINRILLETDYGQALDVFQGAKKSIRIEEALLMYRYKTAKYSFEAPLQLGASIAGAKPGQLSILSRYSIAAGQAYQIQDDILGVFGTRKQIGKPVDSDIREGKKTVLFNEALKRLPAGERTWLRNHYGKSQIPAGQVWGIRHLFEKSGARDYCQKKSKYYLTLANQAVQSSRQISAKSATLLLQLSNYLATRSS